MICGDPGHSYYLSVYDRLTLVDTSHHALVFMKREGPGYPFNVGSYPGTNCPFAFWSGVSVKDHRVMMKGTLETDRANGRTTYTEESFIGQNSLGKVVKTCTMGKSDHFFDRIARLSPSEPRHGIVLCRSFGVGPGIA
jgi:hypothetical protein